MSLSLKCQYAVRALFELAKRDGQGLIRLREIAETQHIPNRFLENILNELRQAGFVTSKRGKDGGFMLSRPASEISVGEVVRFVKSTALPATRTNSSACPLTIDCVFFELWGEAQQAAEQVYNKKTLSDLVDSEARLENGEGIQLQPVP